MTSLSAILIPLPHPVYSANHSQSGSSLTLQPHNSVNNSVESDISGRESRNNSEIVHDEERQKGERSHRRHQSTPSLYGTVDPYMSDMTLPLTTTGTSTYSNCEPQYPGQMLLTPVDTRTSLHRHHYFANNRSSASIASSIGAKSKAPSAVGIDHALKLNFLSTLGPGIPVTPTASVFGDGLNGFITNNDPKTAGRGGGLFGYSPEEEKRLVRKIDWRIIPILGLFYGVSTLNRVNLLNARLFAFEHEVHVTQTQYIWVMAVFFVGFGLAEVPSNLALLYLTPKVWLPASMLIWGFITSMMAWAKSYHALLAARFLLGMAEAGLIPGVLIYISMFYKRSEQTFRMAILQAFSSAAGALGGLLSTGMGHIDGRLNLTGWQWIFIVEGLATVLLAIAAWFLLTSSPASAEWLNQRETSIAIYRIRNDTKIKVTRRISGKNIVAALKDRKVYLFMALNLCISITMVASTGVNSRAWMAIAKAVKDGDLSGIKSGDANQTVPGGLYDSVASHIVLHNDFMQGGFESLVAQEPTSDARLLAQLLSAPTYVMGAMSSFAIAILADRTQQRGMILMGLAVVMIVAYCIALFTLNAYVNYAGVLLLSMGQTPLTPIVTSWLTTNLGGYAKRATAVALFLLSSSIGGIIGTQIYKPYDAPRYTKGHLITISCMLIAILLAALQRFMLKRENYRRNYSVSFGVNPLKYLSKAELRDLNDKHPAFRYTL
ncbi:hypothetical protein BGZ99_003804 [Dissophora globulifera]|uniref:Major facilitator superfamily (MFS) profile domain-containing protein n=1 Tax=Dissophora globulifera TaxID=979702 RepID=A0A9P6RJC6_9FUNG|nr:hypothetical protein BGZ99_003804 [Dissophora globulifera]